MSLTNTSTLPKALGFTNMWGFSPAINLTNARNKSEQRDDEDKLPLSPINILLVEPCDIRHIIKTISEHYSENGLQQCRPIHFYLLEGHLEGLAKDLLMLHLFFDTSIPIRQRAVIFLEIYGNTFVSERNELIIEDTGKMLSSWICDDEDEFGNKIDSTFLNIVDFDLLKYRERDELGAIFRGWKRDFEYNVEALRDYRLRHHYGERYDW